ncbi:MAG TPA: arginine ABC transporter permease ArtQ [Gammaproteobacteria bacterium]|nr:arginine ABC transporter permease ArtQ [Gammaproteobacteria bacterium]
MSETLSYVPYVLAGVKLTIILSLGSVTLACLFGVFGAAARLSPNWFLSMLAQTYVSIIRGVPELVLMLLIFFGGQMLLNDLAELTGWLDHIDVDALSSAIFAIGFIFGAYMSEAFRGAYLAIPKGQLDAAKSIGLSQWVYLRIIVWPQFLVHVLPAFRNNWLVILKTTAFASVVGVHDLVWRAKGAASATHKPFYFLMLAALVYLGFTLVSERFFSATLRRVQRGWTSI